MFLVGQGHDVRAVCRRALLSDVGIGVRARATSSIRYASHVRHWPTRRCRQRSSGPDETQELISLWYKARRSILTSRQHLLNEAEQLLVELPEALRDALPDTKSVRPRLRALARSRSRRRAAQPRQVRRVHTPTYLRDR
jgi:hypothetical protein